MDKIILEACVETVDQAMRAEQQGAHRLELCSRLDLDGLTPSAKLIKNVLANIDIPVKVMVRPRGGDFNYTPLEKDHILQLTSSLSTMPLDGIVFGAILDNQLDIPFIKMVDHASGELHLTIHKAIDATSDPLSQVLALRALDNAHSILTSGGHLTALEGSQVLRDMIEAGRAHSTIIAAGSITNRNISTVHTAIGASEYHGRKIVGELVIS